MEKSIHVRRKYTENASKITPLRGIERTYQKINIGSVEMLCEDCDKRSVCQTLCPEAEMYVNQDQVKQKAKRLDPKLQANPKPLPSITKSTEELILELFFLDRLTQAQVSEKLYISQPYVSKVIKKYKGIMAETLRKMVISRPIIKTVNQAEVDGMGKQTQGRGVKKSKKLTS
jgi:DNA-directed RNA polymerase specialized sigma subunit